MCTDCHHTLAWYDLIPVLSWILLWGKCRYCHKSISWQYPAVELLSATFFIVSYIYWPFATQAITFIFILHFGLWLVILTGLIALFVYDIRWLILPDKIVYPLTLITLLHILLQTQIVEQNTSTLTGSIMGAIMLFGLFYLLFQVSGGRLIGGGDVKLAVALGLLSGGVLGALLLLFLSSVLGSLISLPLLVNKKLKINSHIPFGPLLIAAAFIVYLFGAGITSWLRQKYFYF
jgi:prepilin signal peptidase PulO-like enzyme (type II secretory pathway)